MNQIYRVNSKEHLNEFINGLMGNGHWAVLQNNAHRVVFPVNFVVLADFIIKAFTIEFLESKVTTLVP